MITRSGRHTFFCCALLTFDLSSCGSTPPKDPAAEERAEAEAFRLEQEADFWWRLHSVTGDWYWLRAEHGVVGSGETIKTRAELLEWLKVQDIRRDLAVVTVTPRVTGAPGDPFHGQDAFETDPRNSIASVEAQLKGQGFRRVVFIYSPGIGRVGVMYDSAAH